MKKITVISCLLSTCAPLAAAPAVNIALPERFRVLTEQMFDLRIEATGLTDTNASIRILLDGTEATAEFGTPEITTNNDNNAGNLDKAWTFRGVGLADAGVAQILVEVTDTSGQAGTGVRRIGVQAFKQGNFPKKNVILFIGDAMGATYRDAGRIVAKSQNNAFRGGFFDDLQEMDKMPYSGMVMTYAQDNIVPDSANTATAWATGNKTINGAVNTFADNTDYKGTRAAQLDNPRVETLWSYLKRLHGYKAGIVTTSEVTDATPAGEGGYSINRNNKEDIAKQYVEGAFSSGPVFDVILGGARNHFISRTTDSRNLSTELVGMGFTNVNSRTELNALSSLTPPDKLLGLFHPTNMTVAYDKLGLLRPSDESSTANAAFPDQPFLDEMTARAIATLSKGNSPFILMVEGASIDKESHSNKAAGQMWDTIEFDKAVGVGRAFAAATAAQRKTLTLVSADHDQSMHIIGVVDTNVANATQNVRSGIGYTGLTGGVSRLPDYSDPNGDGYPDNTNRYRIAVGYRTGDHTGSTVPITAEGSGAALFSGVFDQTDIFFKMAKVVSSNTTALDEAEKAKAKLKTIDQNY